MALTLPQALQRLPQGIMSGIAKAVVTTDQLSAVIPFEPVSGDSYRFVREGDLPVGGAFIDDAGVTSEESTGTDDRTTVEFRRLVGNIDVDELANSMAGGMQVGAQLGKKVKATWRKVQDRFINGSRVTGYAFAAGSLASITSGITAISAGPWLDTTRRGPGSIRYTNTGKFWAFRAPGDPGYGPDVAITANGSATLYSYNKSKWITITVTIASATADSEALVTFTSSTNEFEGVEQICAPAMVVAPIATDGDDYSFLILDKLIDMVKVRNNLAFFMNGSLLMKHLAANRALGGNTEQTIQIASVAGKAIVVPVYRGIPILVNDWIPNDETVGASSTCSSIYLASLDSEEGLFYACPSYGGQTAIGETDPRNVPVLGFRITSIGALEGKDATRTRVSWYGAPVLKSALAMARKRGVKTA
jgi:hypothetical protein